MQLLSFLMVSEFHVVESGFKISLRYFLVVLTLTGVERDTADIELLVVNSNRALDLSASYYLIFRDKTFFRLKLDNTVHINNFVRTATDLGIEIRRRSNPSYERLLETDGYDEM